MGPLSPYILSIFGNVLIGCGQCLQKYALNGLESRTQLPIARVVKSSSKVFSNEKITFWSRFKSKTWLFGISLNYFGEIFGNWVALSFLPASVVTPLGVFAVLTNALLAERYLKENMTAAQKNGYLVLLTGVFTILSIAPTTQNSQLVSQMLSDQAFHNRATCLFGTLSFIVSIMVYLTWCKKAVFLWLSTAIPSIFGAMTVLLSKILSVAARGYFAVAVASDKFEVTRHSNSSGTIGAMSASDSHEGGPGALLCGALPVALLVVAIICQEYFKQFALTHHPSLKFQPMFYAFFNVLTAVGGLYLFDELKESSFPFYVGFCCGMTLLCFGARLIQQPSVVTITKVREL
jgi:uncharacterized membrane protein